MLSRLRQAAKSHFGLWRKVAREKERSESPLVTSFMSDNQIYAKYNVGRWSYGTPEVLSWGEGATLKVGSYCSFAAGVKIFLGGEHRVDWVTTYPFSALRASAGRIQGHPATKGDVEIGSDVWVGTEAVILSGVKLGDGCVIGARSIVTKDVPAYAIVGGNPARMIRLRFSEAIVRELVATAWWSWSDESVEAAIPLLLSDNIEGFLTYARVQRKNTQGGELK